MNKRFQRFDLKDRKKILIETLQGFQDQDDQEDEI